MKKKKIMSNSIINTSALIREGDLKLFLSAQDDIGKGILKALATGEYQISEVSSNQQLLDKLPAGSLVIEKKTKSETNEQT